MPTNEERQEIAENLRIMTSYGCKYAEQFYDLLKETVMDSWDFHEFGDVADRLADLIEPEERTCTFSVKEKEGDPYPTCSECGYETDFGELMWYFDNTFKYENKYCPNCGAKVISNDD